MVRRVLLGCSVTSRCDYQDRRPKPRRVNRNGRRARVHCRDDRPVSTRFRTANRQSRLKGPASGRGTGDADDVPWCRRAAIYSDHRGRAWRARDAVWGLHDSLCLAARVTGAGPGAGGARSVFLSPELKTVLHCRLAARGGLLINTQTQSLLKMAAAR